MLKHEELISKMTTQEKLAIITNFSNLDNEQIQDEYKELSQKISLRGLHFNGSVLPDLGNISSSFNYDLMYRYSSFLGYTAYKSNYKFMVSPSINVFNRKNLISKEPYLNQIALKAFISGLSNSSIIPLINYFDNDNNIKIDDFIHMNEYLQCFMTLNDIKLPYVYFDNKNNKYKINKVNEIIPTLGYEGILMNNIMYDGQPVNTISLNKGNNTKNNLTNEQIDANLDELLDLILTDERYNEVDCDYDKLINELVVESTCLLKNDNLLPLRKHYNIAFFTNSNITDVDFSSLSDKISVNVYDKLPSVNDKNKYDLLIMVIDNSEDMEHLNRELHKIHNAHSRNIKIMVVLTTNDVVNTSFDKEVDALVKTVNLNKTNVTTFMDILLGNKCPCGKLNISYPNDDYQYSGNELLTEAHTKYPFGFSLNFGKLTYSDFKYDKNKITFLVRNNDSSCVSDVVQIYMENQRWLGEKHLIFFKKIYLKPKQSQRVSIVLTRDMFMRYNINSNSYRLKKGLYRIYVNNSLTNCLKDFLVIFDISKETLAGKKFKNSALVAVEPRYKGKEINFKYKNYFVYGFAFLCILSCLTFLFSHSFISFIVGAIFFGLSLFFELYKIKPKVTKKFDLDKIHTSDDVIQFDEYYKTSIDDNEYVYDKSEIFKEERNIENKETNKENLYYITSIDDLSNSFKDLYQYLKANGMAIDIKDYYQLCGGICSSRVVYIKSNDTNLVKESVKVVNQFINNLDFDCYNLLDSIKTAKAHPNNIIFTYLDDIDENIKRINNDCKFETMKFNVNINGKDLELSKNICYIIPYEKMQIKYFDFNALVANCNIKNIKKMNYDKELYQIYYKTFIEYITSLSDTYTVDESIYKKFDDLSISFKNFANSKYFNKLICHMEQFVALNIIFKNDLSTLIDNMFAYKLLYYIIRHNFVHLDGKLSKDYMINTLIEIFGKENLTHTIDILENMDFEEIKNA